MNFGYLIIVKDNQDIDYLKMAYALALSIKNTQKSGFDKVALVTDNIDQIDKLKSPWVFDKIIKKDLEDGWDSRSWMDRLTPWQYTVCLDADMLITRDISHWINHLIDTTDLYIPSKSFTYRNDTVESDFYRKTFVRNELPNYYSFFTFFKKITPRVRNFFNLNRYIIKNQIEFKNIYLSNYIPKIIGTDEAFALSASILGIEKDISYDLEFPRVVHMKGMVQGWPWPAEKVTDYVGFYFNKENGLKIGNYHQYDLVHYVEKDLATDELISILEEIAWKI